MTGVQTCALPICISYDAESQKLINLRNQGAMLSDPTIREGFVQGAIAEGLRNAGSNANGAMAGFMGMGMGMQAGGGFMGAASSTNLSQMQMNQAYGNPGTVPGNGVSGGAGYGNGMSGNAGYGNPAAGNTVLGSAGQGNMAAAGGAAAGAGEWICGCGAKNHGKFCSECGSPRPAPGPWTCSCGNVNQGKFCSECGKPRP